MSAPDLAALRELANAAGTDPEDWYTEADLAEDRVSRYDAPYIAALDPATVLALLDAAEAVQRVQESLADLADDFESNIDWSSGRSSYGDNAAWESSAGQVRQLRAALDGTERGPAT